MIDTDKYEGHAQGEWTIEQNDTSDECAIHAQDYGTIAQTFYRDSDKLFLATSRLIADAPLILAAYDKQVRWINDILFRLERMQEASTSQRLRFLLTVQEELEMMIE